VVALQAPTTCLEQLRADYAARRQAVLEALRGAGLDPLVPQGAYFVLCDHTRFGFPDDQAFCEHLIRRVGVAAIPCSAFHADPAGASHLVRFAFCKDLATIHEAGARLKTGLRGLAAVPGS
jgi:N-succinyldiaminopimelate aminotransferase